MYLFGIIALLAFGSAISAKSVRFMPLGDSITENTCWRDYLWDRISQAGLAGQVDLIGSMSTNSEGCRSKSPNFDINHEGHHGYQAVDIANDHIDQWMQQGKPDVVQFMLGTNDVRAGNQLGDIFLAYSRIVDATRHVNPRVKIIVDLLIPLPENMGFIDSINQGIPKWAMGMNRTESPIYIADCSLQGGFTVDMLRDGIHPNARGDQQLGRQIGPPVVRAIRDVIDSEA